MKLTNQTTPQARNYQCNKCKGICCHRDMYDENLCYVCFDKAESIKEILKDTDSVETKERKTRRMVLRKNKRWARQSNETG